MIIVSWYCETCDGAGYIEYPDYDYEENILDVGIRVECPDCGGGGINLIKRLASFITTFDIDRTVCGKVQCRLGGYDEYIDETEQHWEDCVDCIVKYFNKPCKWQQDEVCVGDKSEWCADFVDDIKCGRCKYYEVN